MLYCFNDPKNEIFVSFLTSLYNLNMEYMPVILFQSMWSIPMFGFWATLSSTYGIVEGKCHILWLKLFGV